MTTLAMTVIENKQKQTLFDLFSRYWRWFYGLLVGVIHAMFVPSSVDRQIEDGREQARRYLMYS